MDVLLVLTTTAAPQKQMQLQKQTINGICLENKTEEENLEGEGDAESY